MDVKQTLQKRKTVRAFLDKDVDTKLIKEILEYARLSPSSTNTQPCEVCVVGGEKKRELDKKVLEAFDGGIAPKMDYSYYPDPKKFPTQQKDRRIKLGKEFYTFLGIQKDDKVARKEQWRKNYTSFGAPISFYFYMNKGLEKGSFIDSGIFIQSVALLATGMGLATCIQGALGEYPQIIRDELNIDDGKIILCGMGLGYEDKDAKINSFNTQKIQTDEFVKYVF